jgi:hypothetical protein
MSGKRALVDDMLISNNFVMVKTIYVRGPTLACLAMVLVLLSIGNTPALRVITLREGRILPLYESLLSKQGTLCSTSYGNERWTVNLVPARITRRAGAPLLISFQIFDIFEIFEISTKITTFEKHLAPIELFHGIIISLFY